MKIGITGTRNAITAKQCRGVELLLRIWFQPNAELHHGDCVGADVTVADIAKSIGYKIVCHPPIDESLRAFHASDITKEPLTYFARNRKIVDACEKLIVVPMTAEWQPKGGTWYTHDYAKKKSKPVFVVTP